jgi:DNA-binding PadR family transcriptional regulator
MEEAGLLKSTWDEESARLNRRVYTLSDEGLERLKNGRVMVEAQLKSLTAMKDFYDTNFGQLE